MNKYLIFFIFYTLTTLNSVKAQDTSQLTEEKFFKQLVQIEDEFHNYLPKIELLENQYANDPDFLIGSALLYSKYGNSEVVVEKSDQQWERIFSFDPNNKVALAITVKDVQFYPERLSLIYDELIRRINSAKAREFGSITIRYQINYGPNKIVEKNGEKILQPAQTSQSRLYKYFSQGNNKDIVISDFESAEVKLKAKLNLELAESLDIIDNAEKRDPDNALYNYLKAHIYFKLGNNDFGLNQIKLGTQKEYLKTYYPQIIQSVSKVLDLINYPESLRQYISARYSSTAQLIRSMLLTDDLEPLINEFYEQKKVEPIKEIINMVSLIKEQIHEEPMPTEVMQQAYSEIIENWIKKVSSNFSIENSIQ